MKKDNLFTFFLEWKQGTYISQIAGDSLDMAIEKWCELNETKQNLGITGDAFKLFRENMTDSNAIKVNGLESVWCGSTVMEGELLLLNIVKTTRERRFD